MHNCISKASIQFPTPPLILLAHFELQQEGSQSSLQSPTPRLQLGWPGGGPCSKKQVHKLLKEHDHPNPLMPPSKDLQCSSQFLASHLPTIAEHDPSTSVNCTVLHKLERKKNCEVYQIYNLLAS